MAPLPTARADWCGRRSPRRSSQPSWRASRYRSKENSWTRCIRSDLRNAQNRGARVLDFADAGERHRDVELLLHELQRLRHARFAHSAQAVDESAADHRRLRAERERLEQALAAADAAVEPDVDLVAHRRSDLGQRADRG